MKYTFDFDVLKRLCEADGVSGYEHQVRELIIDEIKEYCDGLWVDACGNVLAHKKGTKTAPKKLMFCAHMDEVGFAVKYINDDGTLLVDQVGMNAYIMPGKRVRIGRSKISGVIGAKPVHLSKGDGKISVSDIFIDIGAKDASSAEELGVFGEFAAFDSDYIEFGDGLIKAKALDDRVGCAVMCALLKEKLDYDTYFAFTTGEEIGGVGAIAAAERIKPDICIVLESTTASDLANTKECNKVCRLKKGPVSPFMDGGTMYDERLYTGIRNIAEKNCIPCQTKEKVAGGTDARNIQQSAGGVRVAAISLPCRYIHTASSVAAKDDAENVYRLTKAVARDIFDV